MLSFTPRAQQAGQVDALLARQEGAVSKVLFVLPFGRLRGASAPASVLRRACFARTRLPPTSCHIAAPTPGRRRPNAPQGQGPAALEDEPDALHGLLAGGKGSTSPHARPMTRRYQNPGVWNHGFVKLT